MTQFVYNNINEIRNRDIFIELNCKYHSYIVFKEDNNLYFKFKSVNKLTNKLKKYNNCLLKIFLLGLKTLKTG